MSIQDGGSAFPRAASEGHAAKENRYGEQDGMTLRDYFAGQALAGVAATRVKANCDMVAVNVAEHAYEWADAMLKARGS